MELELRKCEELDGTWVLLGNGEKWCVPAMPLSKKRKPIIAGLRAIANCEKKLEDRRGAGEEITNEESIEIMEEFMDYAFDMSVSLLKLNYPGLTKEAAEDVDLLDISHAYKFITIAKGEHEIAPLLASMTESANKKKEAEDATPGELRVVSKS